MKYTKLKNINEFIGENINPMKMPDTIFEMYSVPIFETGHPEYLHGNEIGSNKVVVKKNDVLLCKINPRINRVWVVADESKYQNIASSEWIVVRNGEYNPEYLAWYFRCECFKKLMVSEVTGMGGSLTRAQPKAVAEYPVPVVERSEQDKIVEILNKADKIIKQRKEELRILDDLIKARFVEIFSQGKHKLVKASEVCDFITKGTTPPAGEIIEEYGEGMIPFLKVYNLSFTGELLFDDNPQYIPKETHNGKLARSKVYPNDVLMNIVGPPLGKFTIVTDEYEEWNINQAIAIFRAKERILPRFLLHALMQPTVLEPFIGQAVGIRQQNLSLEQCRNLQFPLPSIEEQQAFVKFAEQIDKSKVAVQKALEETQTLFNSLMQEYFG